MVIEISRDIDKFQETVALGLSAKQLVFSIASVVVGGVLVLGLYRFIGLTASAYVAIPVVAPIALGGFYSYNGMSFYEMMSRKIKLLFGNRALTYVSTESEVEIIAYRIEEANKEKMEAKKNKDKKATLSNKGNKEDFDSMKKKTRKMIIGTIVALVVAVAGICAYKYFK